MGQFLLASHDAGGTIPPMLALAEGLVAAGHSVVWLGQPSVRERAGTAGCEFVAFSSLGDYNHGRMLEEQLEITGPMIAGREPGDDLSRLVRERSVEVAVVDANLAGAAAAAEASECRSALLLHSIYKTFVDVWFADIWAFLAAGINQTRAAFGLAPADSWCGVFSAHDRLISVVPSSFDAPVAQPARNMAHFGFLVPRGRYYPHPDLGGGTAPLVVVSLSTTYLRHEDRAQAILDALGALPVRGLLTTAGRLDPGGLRPAPNTVVADWVHHPGILPDAQLVVTHAGLGTISAALSHGVPLVCAPVGRDQYLNAERVSALDAGVAVQDGTDPDALAAAIAEVLDNPAGYRRAAESLAAESAQAGGIPAAVQDLETLLN